MTDDIKDSIWCDRQEFCLLVDGVLFSNEQGRVVFGDTVSAHRAMEAAESGKVIILTVDGKPFSRVVDFTEILL